MLITVAICTWNRSKLLDQTLAEMRRLQIPDEVEWELLIVNNNCSDDTDAVISRHSQQLPIRRLFEEMQGHSNARNCAVRAAKGALIIWTDDDVLVSPQWLAHYVSAFQRWKDVAFFGGPIRPWYQAKPPGWLAALLPDVQGAYALLDLGDLERRLIHDEESPFGANMAFRTEILRRFCFNPRLGIVGKEPTRADETDLIGRLILDGHSGVWVPNAEVRHFIPVERMTSAYLWNYHLGRGRTSVRSKGLHTCKLLWGLPRWVVRQYWTARIRSLVLYPLRGGAWLRATRRAAFLKGVMVETQNIRSAPE